METGAIAGELPLEFVAWETTVALLLSGFETVTESSFDVADAELATSIFWFLRDSIPKVLLEVSVTKIFWFLGDSVAMEIWFLGESVRCANNVEIFDWVKVAEGSCLGEETFTLLIEFSDLVTLVTESCSKDAFTMLL